MKLAIIKKPLVCQDKLFSASDTVCFEALAGYRQQAGRAGCWCITGSKADHHVSKLITCLHISSSSLGRRLEVSVHAVQYFANESAATRPPYERPVNRATHSWPGRRILPISRIEAILLHCTTDRIESWDLPRK